MHVSLHVVIIFFQPWHSDHSLGQSEGAERAAAAATTSGISGGEEDRFKGDQMKWSNMFAAALNMSYYSCQVLLVQVINLRIFILCTSYKYAYVWCN